jgi:mannose-1-phosphate guanylyltransferase
MNLYAAILVGGAGTRLWPLSTARCPKPFVPLGELGTLFAGTVSRARALGARAVASVGAPHFLPWCTGDSGASFLAEPLARNTGPAVALAGAWAFKESKGEGCLFVLPSDHLIEEVEAFRTVALELAQACMSQSRLGVLGIRPTGPETGYGYLLQGEAAGPAYLVERFIEKPGRARAEELLREGRCAWNSGMFCLPLAALREEMAVHCPGYWEAAEAWLHRGDPVPYQALPSLSLDYALMEKTTRILMVPAGFRWSDLGTFRSLHQALAQDDRGNAGWGPGRVEECTGCLIITRRPQTLVRGLSGMAVVETDEGLVVTPLSESEGIRSGVEAILKS